MDGLASRRQREYGYPDAGAFVGTNLLKPDFRAAVRLVLPEDLIPDAEKSAPQASLGARRVPKQKKQGNLDNVLD